MLHFHGEEPVFELIQVSVAHQHRSIFIFITALLKELVDKLLIWSGMFTLEIDDLFNGLVGVHVGYFIDDLL